MATCSRFEAMNYEVTKLFPLRVQVTNNLILTQNLCYNYYYPKPKYLIIGYLDPKPQTLNPYRAL